MFTLPRDCRRRPLVFTGNQSLSRWAVAAALFAAVLVVHVPCAHASSPVRMRNALDALAATSVARGNATYREVAAAVYGDQLESIIAVKRDYRAHTGADAMWFSNYEARLDVPVAVEITQPERRKGCLLTGTYIMATNTARILASRDGHVLAHETGHGLAWRENFTESEKDRADPDLAQLEELVPNRHGAEPEVWQKHFRYLTRQYEFEVRLQALNRFSFALEGRAILTPRDVVRALAGLGVKMDAREVTDLLEQCGDPTPIRDVRRLVMSPWLENPMYPVLFKDAFDVRRMIELSASGEPLARRNLLEKILREAPGHF